MQENTINTPRIETERLRLRPFSRQDIEAIFFIFRDEEVNTYLPWFPLKNIEEAVDFLKSGMPKPMSSPRPTSMQSA